MEVFRLCDSKEVENIMMYRNPSKLGKECKNNPKQNTHKYIDGKRYMHFFATEMDLLYLSPTKGKSICVYDIPDELLENAKGVGKYADFINLSVIRTIPEYAVPSDKLKMEYLKKIYLITSDMDYDYFPEIDELYDSLSCMIDLTNSRSKDDDENER